MESARRLARLSGPMILLFSIVQAAIAGGGPLNVMVLYNADEPAAQEVAEAYRDARSLPVGHLCGVYGVDPLAGELPSEDVDTLIRTPLDACIGALPRPEDIDYIVVVRGLPYRVTIAEGAGSMTSLSAQLQVYNGVSLTTGEEVAGHPVFEYHEYVVSNVANPALVTDTYVSADYTLTHTNQQSYSTASGITRTEVLPHSFRRKNVVIGDWYDLQDNLFVVTRLDGFDYQDALDLIDRGVSADGTYPVATLLCMEGADSARSARDPECEFVTRMLASAGFNAEYLSPHDSALGGETVAAYLTGAADLRNAIDGITYVPGAVTDNLTSYGAVPTNWYCDESGEVCPESESQTAIARLVRAGATGVHGTVAEPYNFAFPNAGLLLLYTFGYNLGESYLMNQKVLYWQNVVVGDPLTSPYATRPVVSWPAEVVVDTPLTISATHPNGVRETRLYLDGVLVASAEGDELEVVLDAEVGEEVSLLVVAEAVNVAQTRLGWHVEEPLPQPDVQGWLEGTVVVLEGRGDDTGTPDDAGLQDDGEPADSDTDATDAGSSAESGDAAKEAGCGCSASSSQAPVGAWLGLVWLGAAVRRRRSSGQRQLG